MRRICRWPGPAVVIVLLLLTACDRNEPATPALPEVTTPVAAQPFRLLEADIAAIHAAYDAGTLTVVELTRQYLDRIEAYDRNGPTINSIITVNPAALEEAAALDARRAAGEPMAALYGIPVLLKDNIDTVDMPTTNGSAVLRDFMAPDDAPITRALREAGALILGKASMGEFASGSYNSVIGQTVNPYHPLRDTGGSSAGSGAAIAANFAVLAVGTDTSTSVRGPSAYNGIVGLRPTTGLISRDGIAPKDLEFDTAGPMARTVTDVARMLGVMGFADPADPLSVAVWEELVNDYTLDDGRIDFTAFLHTDSLRGVRVGVLRNFFGGDPEIDALAETALQVLMAAGATLVNIDLDTEFMERYTGAGQREIRRLADYRFREDFERYLATLPSAPQTIAAMLDIYDSVVNVSVLPARDSVMRLLRDSLQHSTADPAYRQLVENTLPQATADKLAVFESHRVDVLVFPYQTAFAAVIANPTGQMEDPTYVASDIPDPATLAGYNSIGFPSMVVPMGFGSAGLPMGLGFIGRPYEDGTLLGFAYAYEQASRERRPPPRLPEL